MLHNTGNMLPRLRMVDPHPPTQTSLSLEKIERDNEEAFNRLKHMVYKLRSLLGRRHDNDSEDNPGPSHSLN